MPPTLRRPLAALLLVALVLVTYRGVLDLAMLGWDGWPLVAAARVESLGELVGTFGERLMDGRYPHGDFYRPVTHLAFALDAWTSGLDPRGYHRTDLALLAVNTLLLAALVARLAGGWAGLAAGLVFALHPIQLELLPVPARRADALALAFTLGCLLAQPQGRPRGRRALGIGLLALLAAGSKETGALVVPAVIGWHLVLNRGAVRARLAAAAPALIGVALVIVARTVVLGGLGGHRGALGAHASTGELWRGLLAGVLYPEPLVGAPSAGLLLGIGLGLAAALVLLWRHAPDARRALALLGVLALSMLALTSLADRLHAWYAVLLAAPYAGAVGVLIARGARLAREGARLPGALACGVGAVLALSHGLASPPLHDYPLLRASNRWLVQCTGILEREVRAAAPGQVIRISAWPVGVPPNPDGSDVQSLALSQDYTAQAWLELHFPGLACEVSLFDGSRPAPEPGILRVQLVPSVPPGWVEEAR